MKKNNQQNTCELFVEGMHCAACELVIEKKLSKFPGVKKVDAILSQNKVKLNLDGNVDIETIREDMSKLIEPDGYKLSSEKQTLQVNWKEIQIAGIIAMIIIGAFLLIQKLGIINLVSADSITLPFVFFIGIVASLSTCMAVVGGLVLSISSSYAMNHKNRPLILFHISRLLGFFLLGGIIGLIGSAFILTPTISFILNLLLFFVMIILGLNLLETIPGIGKFQIKMPKIIGKNVLKLEEGGNSLTPILLGLVTFVLPCGFTQSMQVYSLTTGSFLEGALTMLVFALGTLPVLALISFASLKLSKTLQSGIFFKTSGFIVLFFAVFNFLGALAAVGIIEPVFNI
jgi:sulfite exporter TauE/SafE/copper chaperone CopZ